MRRTRCSPARLKPQYANYSDNPRSVDVPREPARHHGMSADAVGARLSDGYPRSREPNESGVRERTSGLGYFAEVAAVLMRRAQRLYANTRPELGLEAGLFALVATVIKLPLTLYPILCPF